MYTNLFLVAFLPFAVNFTLLILLNIFFFIKSTLHITVGHGKNLFGNLFWTNLDPILFPKCSYCSYIWPGLLFAKIQNLFRPTLVERGGGASAPVFLLTTFTLRPSGSVIHSIEIYTKTCEQGPHQLGGRGVGVKVGNLP